MLIPAPPPAAKDAPPIPADQIAPVTSGQRLVQVRRERHREALVNFVKRARPLGFPREPQIVFVAVDDGVRRARAARSQVNEVQAVVLVESKIGYEEVEGPVADSGARSFETTMALYVCEGRRRRLEDASRRLVGLDKEDVRR
jgi:hypothetical protein